MLIRVPNSGRELDTEKIPEHYEGAFCGNCGCRVGWINTSFTDTPVLVCDDCAASLAADTDSDWP